MSFKSQKEPRFRFGDKVKEEGCTPFIVKIISGEQGEYFYGDDFHKPFHAEDKLQIYQEPKPKRKITLYRYTTEDEDGVIGQTPWMSVRHEMHGSVYGKTLSVEEKTIEVDA